MTTTPHIAFLNLWAIGLVLLATGVTLVVKPRSQRASQLFVVAVVTLFTLPIVDVVLTILARTIHHSYDQTAFNFDAMFGEPSFIMGRLFQQHAWFRIVSSGVYDTIPIAFLTLAAWYYTTQPLEDATRFMRVMMLMLVFPTFIYIVFPVFGPRYAFSGFPYTAGHFISAQAPPNGMPSIHVVAALLLFWFARRWWVGATLMGAFLFFTITSTLGLGEHYFLDLVPAIPYASLMVYLGGEQKCRPVRTAWDFTKASVAQPDNKR